MELKYIANTGFVTISTANSNLDGTGTTTLLLTAGNDGTLIKSLIIKAQTSTSQGMIRFFIKNASNSNFNLLLEIPVPIVTKSSRDCSFNQVVPINYTMLSGDKLYVSTQIADTFNIIAEGLNWINPTNSTPSENYNEYFEISGAEVVNTANSNLDGSGTTVKILEAGSGASYNGCEIVGIIIKAQGSTTPGMIRLFIGNADGSSKTLFAEVVVPYSTQNSINSSFSHQVIANGSLAIRSGCAIYASTQVSRDI